MNQHAVIRTVLGDIPATQLGICYPHEHLFGAPPKHLQEADFILDDPAVVIQELSAFQLAGGQAMVDMSTRDYNRDIRKLEQVASATGTHVIATTGFNKDRFSKPFVDSMTDEAMDALLLEEATVGIDGTTCRAGVLKAASTLNAISDTAKRVFESVARIHGKTGLPISTHTEAGTMALEQVALLTKNGVAPEHIIIGHLDRKLDWPYILDVAQTGVYLGFDQISKEKYYPDASRIRFILRLIEAGHGHQILLSGDLARRSYWPSYGFGGGPGFTYILWRFVPWLIQAGVSTQQATSIVADNPARALSLRT